MCLLVLFRASFFLSLFPPLLHFTSIVLVFFLRLVGVAAVGVAGVAGPCGRPPVAIEVLIFAAAIEGSSLFLRRFVAALAVAVPFPGVLDPDTGVPGSVFTFDPVEPAVVVVVIIALGPKLPVVCSFWSRSFLSVLMMARSTAFLKSTDSKRSAKNHIEYVVNHLAPLLQQGL